jgi:hypothetical protein
MAFKGQGALDRLGSNPKPMVNPQAAFKEMHSKANSDRIVMLPVNDKKAYFYWELEKLTKLRIKRRDRKGRIGGVLEIHSESGYYSIPVCFSIRNLKTMEFYSPNLEPDRNQWAVLSLPQLNIRLQSNLVRMPKEMDITKKFDPKEARDSSNDVFVTPEDIDELREYLSHTGYRNQSLDVFLLISLLKASQEFEARMQGLKMQAAVQQ